MQIKNNKRRRTRLEIQAIEDDSCPNGLPYGIRPQPKEGEANYNSQQQKDVAKGKRDKEINTKMQNKQTLIIIKCLLKKKYQILDQGII